MIIFDLDDTIINTSDSITPIILKKILSQMVILGIKVDNFSLCLKNLLSINDTCESTREAIEIFLVKNKISSPVPVDYFFKGLQLPKEVEIQMHKDAKSILQQLNSSKNVLALVSYGESSFQWEKMKKAGLDFSIFSKIIISPNKDKTSAYQEIFYEEKRFANHVIVCGDRIRQDLYPAKKLGFHTVHVKKGRGEICAKNLSLQRYVDFTISKWNEMPNVVKRIEEKVIEDI